LFVFFQSVPQPQPIDPGQEPTAKLVRWFRYDEEVRMAQNQPGGYYGALLGGLVAVVAVAFMLSGGEWTGNKKIDGDEDLPPVVSTSQTQR
jgi:hypothetical protein